MTETKKTKLWYKRWWMIVIYCFVGLMLIGAILPDTESNQNQDVETSSNIGSLQEVVEGTNVHRLWNLNYPNKEMNFTFMNSSFFNKVLDKTPLLEELCGTISSSNVFMLSENGLLLLVDADTYEIKCDYLGLIDKDTGLEVPQDEIGAFLTKRENEKNLLDESQDSQTTTPEVEEQTDTATMGEKNALSKAQTYLNVMPFSYSGLIKQLEYEGYSYQEAKYGADNCGANWNEQAALKAQVYLDTMPFSRQGLIDQLIYEGFTQSQAEYGADAVGY